MHKLLLNNSTSFLTKSKNVLRKTFYTTKQLNLIKNLKLDSTSSLTRRQGSNQDQTTVQSLIKSEQHHSQYKESLISKSILQSESLNDLKNSSKITSETTSLIYNHLNRQSKDNTREQSSSGNSKDQTESSQLMLKNFMILLFASILYNKKSKCDYDINDMMITIELDQRIQQQREQNATDGPQQKKKKKKRTRSSIRQNKQATKDQRYGTPEQMIKSQLSSSQDFRSLEQRIIVTETNQNRLTSKDKTDQKQGTQQQQNIENQQDLAKLIFKSSFVAKEQIPSQNTQQKKFNYSKKPQVLAHQQDDEDDIKKMTQSEKRIHTHPNLSEYQKTLKFLDDFQVNDQKQQIPQKSTQQKKNQQSAQKSLNWFTLQQNKINSSNQTQVALNKLNLKQQTQKYAVIQQSGETVIQQIKPQQKIDSQNENNTNTAQFYLPSESFVPLSEKIKNFLLLRGIKVSTKPIINSESKQKQQTKNLKLHVCNKISECKQINFVQESLQHRDIFHHINNFLNPPHIINTVQEAKQLIKLIDKDEFIVGSYIPQTLQLTPPKSEFDTYSKKYPQPDINKLQKQFKQYKYLSSTKKNCFVIVRDKQAAKYLKISQKKIGLPHILSRFDNQLNGKQSQPNCKIEDQFFHSINNLDTIIQKQKLDSSQKIAHKINQLTQKGFTNINITQDLYDKIRHLRQLKNGFSFEQDIGSQNIQPIQKKLFIAKINEQKPSLQEQVNKILQKVSKLNRNSVSIVKTQSEALLKSRWLRIISSDQYGTLRLFDLNKTQQPVVRGDNQKRDQLYFQRYRPNGPFQIEFLSKFISNLTNFDLPHTQLDKTINRVKHSYPGDFQQSQGGNQSHMKLVLFYKDGCKGCKMMQGLVDRVEQLKQRLKMNDKQGAHKIRRQICLRYKIEDPQQLIKIQISKFNILNEDETIQVPQTTPTLHLINQSNKQKIVLKTDQIFNHLNKANANNEQIIQDYMIRDLIQEVQRGTKRFQHVY